MSRRDTYVAGDITREEFIELVMGEMADFSREWSLNASLLERAGVYREIADFIGHVDGDAAVELGCGSGELMRAVRPWNPDMALIGMDMNMHLLSLAESLSGEKARKYVSFDFTSHPERGIVMQPARSPDTPLIGKRETYLFLDDARSMGPTSRAMRDSGAVPALFTLVFPGGGTHLELEHGWYDPDDRMSARQATDTMYVSAMKKAGSMMPPGGQLVFGEAFRKGSGRVAEVFERIDGLYCGSIYRVKDTTELSSDRMQDYVRAYGNRAGEFSRVMPSFREGEYFVLVKLERK